MTSGIVVSVVIPMRNEERYIRACIDSILANAFPPEKLEIIIADGRSTDRSREIVAECAQRSRVSIVLIDNPQKIAPTAMNAGICIARGRYVIRMDAHSEYPANYIADCISELERTGADNVGGPWTTLPGADTDVARTIAFLTTEPAAIGNAQFRSGSGGRFVETVPYGAFRRELFHRLGGFRSDLVRHQDNELNARIRCTGGTIYMSEKLRLRYRNVATFRTFMRQAYLNGIWWPRAWTRYPACFSWRHAVPMLFVSFTLTALLAGFWQPGVHAMLAALFTVYGLSLLWLGAKVAYRNGRRYFVLVPGLTLAYHFCYGASTLLGWFYVFERMQTAETVQSLRHAA
jgi:succinoglycan biosynthesis protein ExoA